MKTKVFIVLSLLISHLLPAQNVKLDIVPHFFNVRTDSLLLSMDITVDIENMDPKNAIVFTPILNGQNQSISLPYIQLNGKQKQKLYLRNQILRKKNNKQENATAYLVSGIDDSHSRTISYRTSIPAASWMNDATLSLRRCIITPKGEQQLKDTLLIGSQSLSMDSNLPIQEVVSIPSTVEERPMNQRVTKMRYKGTYLSPEIDEVDVRNRKELGFNLEEAKMMADINPQMLSLRELYTVALSYTEDRAKFYRLINTSVKLYPVHPISNLNAASAAVEQGDAKSASKFLQMAPHESLAYKNCRGVYELMTGNTYEGIRMLKAAKAEGSEEASYNLNVFFENSKRP